MASVIKYSTSKAFVAFLFFISGFSGLIYQVLWVRQFKLLLGSSITSISIILAVFMGGLLAGAWWIGKRLTQNKVKNELKLYGLLELFIGLFGLVLLFLLPNSKFLFTLFNEPTTDFSYLKLFFNILITSILLILPTAAMGATLPLLVNYFTKKGLFRSTISVFYSINALGGAVASLVAGFYLIKLFGNNGAIGIAIVFNILVGLGAIFLAKKSKVKESEKELTDNSTVEKETSFSKILLLVSFFTGFLALSYEVLWVRCLNYIINNSTYTFSIILFVFLFGIAVGSYLVSLIKTIKHKKILLGIVQLLLAICALLIVNLFYSFAYTDQFAEWFLNAENDTSSWQKDTGLNLTLSVIVFLFPALLMGVSFPLLSDIYFHVKKNKSGVAISQVYVYNTFGSILGALVPIFVLIPLLDGIKPTLIVLAVINCIIGAYFIFKSDFSKKWIVGLVLLLLFGYSFKIIPKDNVLASLELVNEDTKDIKPLYYEEGVMATVKVYDKHNVYKSLSIDGITIASESFVMKEKMIAHIPFLTDRKIDKALAVGLASGSTVKSILKHPEINQLDVVEIVPSVMNTLKYFNKPNDVDLTKEQKVKIYIDDVVSYLTYCENKYDLISSDGKFGFLNRANTTMLSQEYYELCSKKLTDEGVFMQWISTQIPNEHFKTILSTVNSVFPYSELFLVRQNLFILSSKKPIWVNYNQIAKAFQNEKVKQDLLGSNFYLPEEILSAYVGPNPYKDRLNTMNQPVLEYHYNDNRAIDIAHFETSPYRNITDIYQQYLANEKEISKNQNTITNNPQISFRLNKAFIESRINYYKAHFSLGANEMNKAIKYFDKVISINHPNNENDIAVAAKTVGEYYFKQKNNKKAVEYLDLAVKKLPGYSGAYTMRGVVYYYMSEFVKSRKDFEHALTIDPNDPTAQEFIKELNATTSILR